jgi:probable lipoprotein NlpC
MLKKQYIKPLLLIISIALASCKNAAPANRSSSVIPKKKSNTNSQNGGGGSNSHQSVIKTAQDFIGTPYKLGGTDKHGIDCSGLAMICYQSENIKLPRTADAQAETGKRIYIGELQTGDLVFFTDKKGGSKITHVGIVHTTNHPTSVTFIHASTSKGVREDELMTGYWRDHYVKASRVK